MLLTNLRSRVYLYINTAIDLAIFSFALIALLCLNKLIEMTSIIFQL
jgi:hypothetical protein